MNKQQISDDLKAYHTLYENQKAELEQKELDKQKLIEYIYDFAWNYGRFYHLGSAEKIKEAVKERLQLPEEFLGVEVAKKEVCKSCGKPLQEYAPKEIGLCVHCFTSNA